MKENNPKLIDFEYSLIFVDTNILLGPLKPDSGITMTDLVSTLYAFHDKVIIPRHVCDEFKDNIITVYKNSQKQIKEASTEVNNSCDAINKTFQKLGSNINPISTRKRDSILSNLARIQETRLAELRADAKLIDEFLLSIFQTTEDFYDSKQENQMMAQFDARCKRKIAPGFKDENKTNENDFGDFYIWQEILEHMEKVSDDYEDAIFITNDSKHDWRDNRSIGQLRNEYSKYVYDGLFSVMSFREFKDYVKNKQIRFASKVNKIKRISQKESWNINDWNEFEKLIEETKINLPVFMLLIEENQRKKFQELIKPYSNNILKWNIDFLNLTPRGKNCLLNAGINNLQEILAPNMDDFARTRNIGKSSLSEICAIRTLLNDELGPFVDNLEAYSKERYKQIRKIHDFE